MASITCCGTCVPPGPSRKTAACSLIVCASAGKCERTQARSSAVGDDEEACSAIGIADILNESVVSARGLRGSAQFRRGAEPHKRLLKPGGQEVDPRGARFLGGNFRVADQPSRIAAPLAPAEG